MMNFQQALKALELDYQANWADLKLPAKGSDNSPQQEKAIQVIELIYQYPQNREVCLILEATPKELRQQFLNDRSPDYLNTLAQSIPFLKCNQLWQDLESKGIVPRQLLLPVDDNYDCRSPIIFFRPSPPQFAYF